MRALDYTIRVIPDTESPSSYIEPVTIEDVKAHCRIDSDLDDVYLEGLITSCRRDLEQALTRWIGEQTIELALANWPASWQLSLRRRDVQSLLSVAYTKEDGTVVTMLDANVSPEVTTEVFDLSANSVPGFIFLKPNETWPTDDLYPGYPIVIRYRCGIPVDTFRQDLVHALYLLIGHRYERREAAVDRQTTEIPLGIGWILSTHVFHGEG